MGLHYRHGVFEQTDSANRDFDFVAVLERERVGRHNTRSGEQYRAVRENLAAEEKFRKISEAAFDFSHGGFSAEGASAGAVNFDFNCPFTRGIFGRAQNDPRAE